MVSRAVELCGTELVDPPMRTLTRGPALGRVRQRRAALHPLRRRRGAARHRLPRPRRELGHLHAGAREPAHRGIRRPASPSPTAAPAPTPRARWSTTRRSPAGSDGSLDFEVVADPRTDVLTNRTGFIVLHPVDGVAGQPVRILHVDGREETSRFPQTIDPALPLPRHPRDVARDRARHLGDLHHGRRRLRDGGPAQLVRRLLQDLRPPADAAPGPTPCPRASRVAQASASRSPARRARRHGRRRRPAQPGHHRRRRRRAARHRHRRAGRGGGARPRGRRPPPPPRRRAGWSARSTSAAATAAPSCERYRALAELTGAEIILEIITRGSLDPAGRAVASLAAAAAEAGLAPAAVAVFPAQDMKSVQPDAPWPEMPSFEETYAAARAAFPGARLGGGMAAYFTELNRKRPPADLLDYVTHTTCPIVHAADDRSVMETIEALPHQILSTRAFMGDAPLPHRPEPDRLPREPLRQLHRAEPRQRPRLPQPDRPAPARPLQRRLDARLHRRLRPRRPRGGGARRPDRPLRPHPPPRPTSRSPTSTRSTGPAVYPVLPRDRRPRAACRRAAARDRGLPEPERSRRSRCATARAPCSGSPTPATVRSRSTCPRTSCGGARIVTLDAEAFEALTTQPDYLDTAERAATDGALTLDAYAVARITAG